MTKLPHHPEESPQKGDSAAPVPAVIYAAKSTEDRHGSIPTQLADAREMAAREGWTVVGEYHDEGFSAYRGNRGPGLDAAKRRAAEAAAEHGQAMLVAQHSDRFARGAGDAPGAADHLGEVYFAMRRQGVRLRSAQDDANLEDALRAVLIGERNSEDSRRKAEATRAGLRRRKERGEPVGYIPVGYRAQVSVEDGRAVTRRVVDPDGAALVERIMSAVERGHTFGEVSRRLNAEGVRTARGGHWTTRAVRRVVTNEDYTGSTGYPAIIDRQRWEVIQAGLTRLDPVAVQARKGGRAAPEDFLLHGVAFCLSCGAPMRVRRYRNGTRSIAAETSSRASGSVTRRRSERRLLRRT